MGKRAHGQRGERSSAIDLTFISPSIIGLCEWVVLGDIYLSDHFPISILFNRTPARKNFFSHKIKHTKPLDEQFLGNLHSSLDSLRVALGDPVLSPIQKYAYYTEHLLRQWPIAPKKPYITERQPSRGVRKGFSSPTPWWSDTCQRAVDSRRSLLSAFRKHPTYSNYLAFKKQEAIARRTLRAEKRRGWKEFFNRLNPNTPITYIWKFVKQFRNRQFELPATLQST